jgi:hypothetical protein
MAGLPFAVSQDEELLDQGVGSAQHASQHVGTDCHMFLTNKRVVGFGRNGIAFNHFLIDVVGVELGRAWDGSPQVKLQLHEGGVTKIGLTTERFHNPAASARGWCEMIKHRLVLSQA